jgi:hypothetical protein
MTVGHPLRATLKLVVMDSGLARLRERPGMTGFCATAANSLSPNDGKAATLPKSREDGRLALTSGLWQLWFAQPLGSQAPVMRNIIAKLLIAVVPRHTAGDG